MEPYAIEGLGVGQEVHPESWQYKRFDCKQSEQYADSYWCTFSETVGGVSKRLTILHLYNNIVTYINKELSPASFPSSAADREIRRLSTTFGQSPHIYRSSPRSLPGGIIATWGDIRLQPLAPSDLLALAQGESTKQGVLVDYLINFHESARLGLPVYSLSGGKGYVWVARFDKPGKEKLRFFAADPSQMTRSPDLRDEQADEEKAKARSGQTKGETAGRKSEIEQAKPDDSGAPLADKFGLCLNAKFAQDKIDSCSSAISSTLKPRQLERAYLRRGNAYMELKRFQEAANDFSALIAINPKIAGYYDNRQNALKSLGRLDEALDDANRAIRLAPTESFGYRSRGTVYEAMGRLADALDDYSTSISINPGDAGLYVARGKILARKTQLQGAIDDFTKALAIDPKNASALRERGFAFKSAGKLAEAISDLEAFTSLEHADQETINALSDLRASSATAQGESVAQSEKKDETQPSAIPPLPSQKRTASTNSSQSNSHSDGDGTGLGFLVLFILLYLYFLPSTIAYRRNTANKGGILIVNVLLGWTLLGWIVALIMACGTTTTSTSHESSPDLVRDRLFRDVFGWGKEENNQHAPQKLVGPIIHAEGVVSGTPYWRTPEGDYCATIGGKDIAFASLEMLEATLKGDTLERSAGDHSTPDAVTGDIRQTASGGVNGQIKIKTDGQTPDDEREAKELRMGWIAVSFAVAAIVVFLLIIGSR